MRAGGSCKLACKFRDKRLTTYISVYLTIRAGLRAQGSQVHSPQSAQTYTVDRARQAGLSAETKYVCNLTPAFDCAFSAGPPRQLLHVPNVLVPQNHLAMCFLQAFCIGFVTGDLIMPRALLTGPSRIVKAALKGVRC